jgi:hypothetical protein
MRGVPLQIRARAHDLRLDAMRARAISAPAGDAIPASNRNPVRRPR